MGILRWLWVTAPLFCLPPAYATTWATDKVDDPVSGESCQVNVPASSGSYVYQWPEKYDQVFWPITDPMGIWLCAGSGFAAFIGDIGLEGSEKSAIAAFLRDAPRLPMDAPLAAKLERLEAVYALRQLSDDTRARIMRALAFQYESDGQQAKANALRAKAHALMDARLGDPGLPPDLRLQYLFVTANYARERGDATEADRRVALLATRLAEAARDEKLKGYAEYLQALVESARAIVPGGALAPAP